MTWFIPTSKMKPFKTTIFQLQAKNEEEFFPFLFNDGSFDFIYSWCHSTHPLNGKVSLQLQKQNEKTQFYSYF